jgi:hypothetical protein
MALTLTLPAEAALRAIQATFGCPAAITALQVLGGRMDAQRFLPGLTPEPDRRDSRAGIVAHRRG